MGEASRAVPYGDLTAFVNGTSLGNIANGLGNDQPSFLRTGYHANAMSSFMDPSLNPDAASLRSVSRLYGQPRRGEPPALPEPTSDIGILSAETYAESQTTTSYQPPSGVNQPSQIWGVVVVDPEESPEDTEMKIEDAAQAAYPRKKVRAPSREGEDLEPSNKRSRGRPRLASRDENAGDRRRTQIRLAQRAYRLRKETTISSLKQRVAQLESSVEGMNQSFLEFNDELLRSDLFQQWPALANSLENTRRQFVYLAQIPKADLQEDLLGDEQDPPADRKNRSKSLSLVLSAKKSNEQLPRLNRTTDSPPQQQMSNPLSHVEDEPSRQAPRRKKQENVMQDLEARQLTMEVPALQPWSQVLTSPSKSFLPPPQFSLKTSNSLSVHETTFAGRLKRAALESAFELLHNPHASPRARSRVFEFCFKNSNPDRALTRMKLLLNEMNEDRLKQIRESLHQPPQDQPFSDTPYGPERSISCPATNESAQDKDVKEPRWYVDLFESNSDPGSEWFDASGVEDYLRSKGISLKMGGSYAEIEIEDASPGEAKLSQSPESLATRGQSSAEGSGSPTGHEAFYPDTNDYFGAGPVANHRDIMGYPRRNDFVTQPVSSSEGANFDSFFFGINGLGPMDKSIDMFSQRWKQPRKRVIKVDATRLFNGQLNPFPRGSRSHKSLMREQRSSTGEFVLDKHQDFEEQTLTLQ